MSAPVIVDTPHALRLQSDRWHAAGLSVGLVPTMGALHAGHRSLLHRAVGECDRVVCSIFVNPAQFGAGEDFERYPRTPQRDLDMLVEEGVHAAYVPVTAGMYPPGSATEVRVGGTVGGVLEACQRPGHFDGVALVVAKLFIATRADRAYFGQKDAQQCAVVNRLAADLDTGTDVVVCPTVRDADGLALSSRNAYLTADERQQALAIPAGLAAAAERFAAGERRSPHLVDAVVEVLSESPDLAVDYVAVVDADTFADAAEAAVGAKILVAARIGRARLIDTLTLGVDQPPATRRPGGDGAAVTGRLLGTVQRSRPCSVR